MTLSKITPVCTVDAIEPSLPFWVDQLGFQAVAEVPHGEALGFVMLVRDEVTVMLQSRASVVDDLPFMAEGALGGGVMLYIDVVSLDEAKALLGDAEVVVPERETFYGTREIWVRSPGGHIVGFAQNVGDGGGE